MTLYTPSLRREIFPTWIERTADRLYTRLLRFRARLRILWRVTRQSKLRVRIAVLLFIAFTLSPLDFIPDVIPFVGALDEILVFMLVVWYCKRHDPAVARALTHLFS